MRASLPVIQHGSGDPTLAEPARTKPPWLRVEAPGGPKYVAMKNRARRLSLATVCEEARCPNIAECWSTGTATFMLMGEACTRACRFCAVDTVKRPPPLDPDEPRHIGEAVADMGLSYVVITSVNRDDVPDGGAAHLAECLHEIRRQSESVLIEMLIPDFLGMTASVEAIVRSPIQVLAHNVETVERLTPRVRDPRANYLQSLRVLEHAKETDPNLLTKSSLMLGLGETEEEIAMTFADLRAVGVDIVTLGQYLRPTVHHLPVVEYVHPNTFERLADRAMSMGFGYVAAGPLVRSSYRAGELYVERRLKPHADPRQSDTKNETNA